MGQLDRFSSYQYAEGKTGIGQMVEFTCPSGTTEQVKEFLQTNVRTIDVPTTGRVNVAHGSYGRYTRYDVTQHRYHGWDHEDGGGGGYIEVLEIKDPPDGRSGYVILDYRSGEGYIFSEWDSLSAALAGDDQFWKHRERGQQAWSELGCKRLVNCGVLTPWFYAIGNQELVGDYVFPEGLVDDPVFVPGRQFVVCPSEDEGPRVKTCLGTRLISGLSTRHSFDADSKLWVKRMVHWNDGSVTLFHGDDNHPERGWVRPLVDDEMWITEAVEQFRRVLTGQTDCVNVKFLDGTQFIGRIAAAKTPADLTKPGKYYATVTFADGETRKGVVDFSPTQEDPDVASRIRSRLERDGKKITYLAVRRNTPNGKKWAGVFFDRSGA